MDASTAVVLGGVITSLIGTGGAVIIAFINNNRERASSANEGVEAVLRQQIAFGAEQIASLEKEIERLKEAGKEGS